MQGKLLLAIISSVGVMAPLKAEVGVPCLIFSGGADKECTLDLSRYNRITFGENSMTISSTANPEDKVELFYSIYYHLELGNAQVSGIENMENPETKLIYDEASASLRLNAPAEVVYTVGVFSLNGIILRQSDLNGGKSLSIESLHPGVYIAVASRKNEVLRIKFVK